MDSMMRHQVDKVMQLHPTIARMAGVLEAPVACEEMQWLGMTK
jgi:hypothetical protein